MPTCCTRPIERSGIARRPPRASKNTPQFVDYISDHPPTIEGLRADGRLAMPPLFYSGRTR